MNSLGIDIGGTRTKATLVDSCGDIQTSVEVETQYEVAALSNLVRDVIHDLAADETPVGISSPGLAAADNRSIAWMQGRMETIVDLDWGENLGREICVLNDGHAAAIGEAWIGAMSGAKNALLLTLGTGVGGGIILDGELFPGSLGRAGHFGHITVDLRGEADIVGTRGSLEDWVGNHSVSARTHGQFSDTHDLVDAVLNGDQDAEAYWMQSVEALAAGLTSLINAFDPEVIVLGGGIAASGPTLFQSLRKMMDRCEWRPYSQPVRIVPAELGSQAGAIGAAKYAFTHSQQQRGR